MGRGILHEAAEFGNGRKALASLNREKREKA
jgi:hypothetical protein